MLEAAYGRNSTGKKTRGLRTCIACRCKAPLASLIRFVFEHGRPVCVLPGVSRTGRGYGLCPTAACFEKAVAGRKSPLRECGAQNAAGLLQMALAEYKGKLEILRRSGGFSKAENMEMMVARLQGALETLSCRSGETHVR